MYSLYLTFILSISHFYIFYKYISHKILIHTSHISLNFMSRKVYIYKIHVHKVSTCNSYTYYKHNISQYIYIYIYLYIFLTISTHLKNISNIFPKTHYKSPFLWKIYIYNVKSPSYERQKLIKLKALLMEGNITHTWLKNQKIIT